MSASAAQRCEREYDAANIGPTQRFRGWQYDALGLTRFEGYPREAATSIASFGSNGVSTTYDVLGRPLTVSRASELGALNTEYAYLPGFQTQVTDPRGNITTTSYQAFDQPDTSRPLVILAPENVTTTIARDVFGKPTSIARSGSYGGTAVSAVRRFVYDTNQRLCKRIDPESGATLFDYDTVGNLTWSADGQNLTSLSCDRNSVPASERTTRAYDSMNRLIRVTYPASSAIDSYTYEPDGLLKTAGSEIPNTPYNQVWTYTYNKRRLLTSEHINSDNMTFSYSYDAHGHLSQSTYPGSLTVVTHAPNALGQPTRANNYAFGATYFPNGALRSFTYGNSVMHSVTQNARQLPSRVTDAFGSAKYSDFGYSYDANANVAGITDYAQSGLQTRTMGYDGLDRLTAANAPNLWGAGSFAYDPLDNLRVADVSPRLYRFHYATDGKLATIKTTTGATVWGFAYDARGNQVGRTGQTRIFDRANRLRSIIGVADYYYDGHGRRLAMLRADTSVKYTLYTRDGKLRGGPDSRRSGSDWQVYLGDRLVANVFHSWNDPALHTVTYLHTDLLGSPVVETSPTRVASNRSYYAPYGEVRNRTVDGAGYTGHYQDGDSGLTYMQQRYYDPLSGRFLSIDPVVADPKTGGNFNRYWYANNNPYRYTDPDGRQSVGEMIDSGAEGCGAVSCAGWATLKASWDVFGFEGVSQIADKGAAAGAGTGAMAAFELLTLGKGKVLSEGGQLAFKVLEREGDVIIGSFKGAAGEARVITEATMEGDTLFLRGTHIEGKGTLREALGVARQMGDSAGAKKVVIEPGTRTTGANPGRTPRPLVIDLEKKKQ